MEDVAFFGHNRKILELGANAGNGPTILRRAWIRYEGCPLCSSGPIYPGEIGYDQKNVTYENVLITWNRMNGQAFSSESYIQGFSTTGSALLGSIVYGLAGDVTEGNPGISVHATGGSHPGQTITSNFLAKDNVVFFHSSLSKVGYVFGKGSNNIAQNNIGISSGSSSCGSGGGWTCTGNRTGSSVSTALAGTGNTMWQQVPGICRRYVNRTLTTEGLWPWPMNQRIKDALVQSGRDPVDVTQTMEGLFGPISQSCKTSTTNTEVTPEPRNLRVIDAN
jgi:hypothetical protein